MEEIKRQSGRYHSDISSDPYYEMNKTISLRLDEMRNLFIDKKILDIGAGEIPWKKFYEGLHVTTCDVSQNSDKSIDIIIDTSGLLPMSDKSFDFIFIWDVLEHVKNDIVFVKECNRILKDGGAVVGNVPFLYRFHEEPHDYRRYTPTGLAHLFENDGGFQRELIVPIGSHYFIAKKILEEISFKVSRLKGYYLRFCRYLLSFGPSQDISFNSPFSYFFKFNKK